MSCARCSSSPGRPAACWLVVRRARRPRSACSSPSARAARRGRVLPARGGRRPRRATSPAASARSPSSSAPVAPALLPAVGAPPRSSRCPTARSARRGRTAAVIAGYVAGGGRRACCCGCHGPTCRCGRSSLEASLAVAAALPAAHRRYLPSRGRRPPAAAVDRLRRSRCRSRSRSSWPPLRLLVGWPPTSVRSPPAATVLIPFALAVGTCARSSARASTALLVHTVSITGLTFVVVAVYLVIVVGLGRTPSRRRAQRCSACR